jgi:hypothetical protein
MCGNARTFASKSLLLLVCFFGGTAKHDYFTQIFAKSASIIVINWVETAALWAEFDRIARLNPVGGGNPCSRSHPLDPSCHGL